MEDNSSKKIDTLRKDLMENVVTHLIPGIGREKWNGVGFSQGNFKIDLSSDFVLETDYDPKSKRFLHFTSLRTLQSIINENAIRLYNLKNVNDPNEYNFIAQDLVPHEDPDLIKSDTFILSLCDIDVLHGPNILNLWRLYGNGGLGVAIEFEIDVENAFRHYFLGKVLYGQLDFNNFKQNRLDFEDRNKVAYDISSLIRIAACFHKSEYFSIEEEIRLMLLGELASYPNQFRLFQDFNIRNESVFYHRLELGQSSNDIPRILIKRIQIGFRHSKESFEGIQVHLLDSLRNGGLQGELPIIEHSPLTNIYI